MEPDSGSLPDTRIREYDSDLQQPRALGPGDAGPYGPRSINDIGRINPDLPPNELNSPLFLPCSRPKQG